MRPSPSERCWRVGCRDGSKDVCNVLSLHKFLEFLGIKESVILLNRHRQLFHRLFLPLDKPLQRCNCRHDCDIRFEGACRRGDRNNISNLARVDSREREDRRVTIMLDFGVHITQLLGIWRNLGILGTIGSCSVSI